jgi:hypothetical protein
MELYRVHPWVPGVELHQPYGAMFVPPKQGYGRWDNPDEYQLRYFALTAVGAVAETFGSLARWSAPMFNHPGAPDAVKALSTYEMPDETKFADLNDPSMLVQLGVGRVTDVIERNLKCTQTLAKQIYETEQWDGIRWWSYYHPTIEVAASWADEMLSHVDTQLLTLDHSAVQDAADLIVRHID